MDFGGSAPTEKVLQISELEEKPKKKVKDVSLSRKKTREEIQEEIEARLEKKERKRQEKLEAK